MRPCTRHKPSMDPMYPHPSMTDTVPRTRPRLFGLTEAPTFYPTALEFADPMKYIASIQKEGEKYGIIKIVPPAGYSPGFKLNKETFRFRTRLQKLNSMEGETRANVNYLEQLSNYHISAGTPIHKIPQLDKRPIDLFKLKKQVAREGGYHTVTSRKKWAEIGRSMDYNRKECTSMSNALKSAYYRFILPYENWLSSYKSGQIELPTPRLSFTEPSMPRMKRVALKETVYTMSYDKEEEEEDDEDDLCQVCHEGEEEGDRVVCEGCGDWHCIKCLTAAGGDYGFEDGDEYSLSAFQDKCKQFKHQWFSKKEQIRPDSTVSEEDCEDEFWRLVENPHETCQVEYGADLHSTQHGSALGDLQDPWNLNVIPALPKSLFSHIQADISGMMVPWLYIGMCFSAFCWHNEDHYTYSINYMHWGETKTWYGIPGSDTMKFEESMRKAVPELFEQQPDLLFQLVTMLSPGRLLEDNVSVYAVDQRPGQFVVTFPKSYHSGFNHGYNFCEAVNFALPEWADYGLECVQRYKEYRRQPCFSHDELILNVAEHDKTPETGKWLHKALLSMKTRELKERNALRSLYPTLQQVIKTSPQVSDVESQCLYCHCYSYLSHIACQCTDAIACLDHCKELCSCDISSKTLFVRMTDEQLIQLVNRGPDVTKASLEWLDKVDRTLHESPPTLKALRQLIQEGERISAPEEPLEQLHHKVTQISEWIEQAKKYAIRKHQNRRKDSASREFNGDKFNQIQQLRETAKQIYFDASEVYTIRKTAKLLAEFKERCLALLDSQHTNLEAYREAYDMGTGLNADIPEMVQLKMAITQHTWRKEAPTKLKGHYNSILQCIEDAKECRIPIEDPLYQEIVALEQEGARWAAQYSVIADASSAHLDHYRDLLAASAKIPTPLDTLYHVREVVKLGTETVNSIQQAIQKSTGPQEEKASAADLSRIMHSLQWLPIHIEGSNRVMCEKNSMDLWTQHAEALFESPKQGTHKPLEQRMTSVLSNIATITEGSMTKEMASGLESAGIIKKKKSSNGSTDQYCLCRRPESGWMIECDVCHEWYHGPCVKASRREAKAHTYVCPICDGGQMIPRQIKRPTLEECVLLFEESKSLLFVPKEFDLLSRIIGTVQGFKDRVQSFCRSKTHLGAQDLKEIRSHLRQLEGLEVYLRDETDFLRRKIQTLSAILPSINASSFSSSSVRNYTPSFPLPLSLSPRSSGSFLHSAPQETMAHSPSSTDERVYCLCRRSYNPNGPDAHMIGCDTCHEWFHLSCVNVAPKALPSIEHYMCPMCTKYYTENAVHPTHFYNNSNNNNNGSSNSNSNKHSPIVLPTPPLPPALLPSRNQTVIKLTVRPPTTLPENPPSPTDVLYDRKRKRMDTMSIKENVKREHTMSDDVYVHAI
ncbi:PLU-1-like protein-domain-containing protein [Spinellus fusiger]|nr:PLU-1-like protein-domain-containing protein [Spinellus fusiger]